MKGNEAFAEAAVQAGCKYFFGYPITPQNEIPEYMSKRLPEVGGVYLQAESEVAGINMIFGAAGTGFRTLISSSSPGISLMSEGISYITAAELPCVIINVMRGARFRWYLARSIRLLSGDQGRWPWRLQIIDPCSELYRKPRNL